MIILRGEVRYEPLWLSRVQIIHAVVPANLARRIRRAVVGDPLNALAGGANAETLAIRAWQRRDEPVGGVNTVSAWKEIRHPAGGVQPLVLDYLRTGRELAHGYRNVAVYDARSGRPVAGARRLGVQVANVRRESEHWQQSGVGEPLA